MSESSEPISRFKGDYFFLSNFAPSPITIDYKGEEYSMPTGEHCFQAMKIGASEWDEWKTKSWLRHMSQAPTPSKSKYLGRSIQINVEKWNTMSYACMVRTQKLKYNQNPELAEKLLLTGSRTLIEGTEWGDKLWGVDEKGVGENLLGKILMSLREELTRGNPER